MSALTSQTVDDGGANLLIGALRCPVAVGLARETHDLVLGEATLPQVSNQIRAAIDATPGTTQVLDFSATHPGPEEVLVAAKVETDPSASQIARVIDDAGRRVRGFVPIDRPGRLSRRAETIRADVGPGRAAVTNQPTPPPAREETPPERLDRNMSELLQEVRVIAVGVQVLFAFLLTIAFSQREAALSTTDRALYLGVLFVTMGATGCLLAPAAHHRLRFRRGRKAELVNLANFLAKLGLGLLAVSLAGTLALVADVLFGAEVAIAAGLGTALTLAAIWLVPPATHAMRGLR